MLISLLDLAMQGQRGSGRGILSRGRLDSAGEQLADLATGGGDLPNRGDLPGGVAQSGPLPPGPAGPGGPGGLPSPQPAPAGPGVGGQLPRGQGQQQGQPTPQQQRRQMRQQSAASIVDMVSAVNGGELPEGLEDFVDREARMTEKAGPGREESGFLSRLFLGETAVPGLSQSKQEQLRNNAMVMTGLNILGRQPGVSAFQAAAQGILQSRLFATRTASELAAEQTRQRQAMQIAKPLFNSDLPAKEQIQEARRRALALGQTEEAKLFSDMLKEIPDELQNREFQVINGQGFFVSEEEGLVFDMDGNVVDSLPEQRPEINPTRLNQLEREFDKSREQAQTAAQALGDARQIRAKLEEEGSVSSADQRVLANRLQQMLDAGNMRERTIEAIAQSGGVQGGVQGLVGLFNEGAAPATVARDLIQAIDRASEQQRASFQEDRQTFAQRLSAVPGIDQQTFQAALGVDPFARLGGGAAAPVTDTNFDFDPEEDQFEDLIPGGGS